MRYTSLSRHLTLLCGVMVLFACRNSRAVLPANEPEFSLAATAQRYVAAMGKGRGVLFRIRFSQPDSLNILAFELDSLVVGGKTIPSSWTTELNKPLIEGNYFVAEKDPEPGTPPRPESGSPDPILFLSQYQPAALYFHYEKKAYALSIPNFESISE